MERNRTQTEKTEIILDILNLQHGFPSSIMMQVQYKNCFKLYTENIT